jgi:primary-amine oxidase
MASSLSSLRKGLYKFSTTRVASCKHVRLPSDSPTAPRSPHDRAIRFVWSTGQSPPSKDSHPLCSLTPDEIRVAADAVKAHFKKDVRFVAIALAEPSKAALSSSTKPPRQAEIIILNSSTGIASEITMSLADNSIISTKDMERGIQPLLTPDDCILAEAISKGAPEVQAALKERYGITDMSRVAADPWSVHLASDDDVALTEPDDPNLPARRLVQTFLYQRVVGDNIEDNHYAHPIDITPIVDLISQKVVRIDGLDRLPPPKIPQLNVNYHRDLLKKNSYLQTQWRSDTLKTLDITQPGGPSFRVTDNLVEWQGWTFRVGWNYREGLVLHQVHFQGRSVVNRLSLVEMAVPYGDPNTPFPRKCAFDVGDYGLGFCANSLELGCDCLGHIHYFE